MAEPTLVLGPFSSDTQASSYNIGSLALIADRFYLLAVTSDNASASQHASPTVTQTGVTWTLVKTRQFTNRRRVDVFRCQPGSNVPAADVTVTFESSMRQCLASVTEWTDVPDDSVNNGAAVVVRSDEGVGNDDHPTVTLSGVTPDNRTFGVVGRQAVTSHTPGVGYTEIVDHNAGANVSTATEWRADGTNVVDMTTPGSNSWAIIGIEIATVSTPPPTSGLGGIGSFAIGTQAFPSTTVHDLPTVTLTAPTGTVSTGGPVLEVTWTYSQEQGDTQARFRVELLNDAGTVTFYDSGFQSGADVQHDIDLVAEGVPTDTADISVRVTVESDQGPLWTARTPLSAFAVEWGVVTATITAPADLQLITTSQVTVAWTFASTRSKTQAHYRVRLLSPDSGAVHHDSGWVADTVATSYLIPFLLTDDSSYKIGLQLRNNEGVPNTPEVFVTFTVNLQDEVAYPDVASVGTVFEVAVNGQGFMLFDGHEGQPFSYERQVIPLEAERLATNETPFTEAVERYIFTIWKDFRGGAGQLHHDGLDAIENAFLDSDGVNPFEKGGLTLLESTALEEAATYSGIKMVVVGDDLYWVDSASTLKRLTAPGGAPSTITITGGHSISDVTTDGTNWYTARGPNGIYRGTTAEPAQWSAVQATVVGWAGGRVCAALAASGSTPNRFTTLNDAGAEEVTGGRVTLPAGWTITGFTGGQGKVWFGARSGQQGLVYVWDLTSAAPYVALELPAGQVPVDLFWYQGQVMLRAKQVHDPVSTAHQAIIYRCVPGDDGTLTPFRVLDIGEDSPTLDFSAGTFAGTDRFVVFSWRAMDGTNGGVGAIDLSTGGWSKWWRSPVAGPVPTIVMWQGHCVFAVGGQGIYRVGHGFVSAGSVKTSVSDGDSNLDKIYDQVALVAAPLKVNESIAVDYTFDTAGSYTALAEATINVAGQSRKEATLDKKAQSIGLKVTLAGPGTTTPTLLLAQVRYHVTGLADEVIVLPVDCGDQVKGLNGAPLAVNGPGAGVARARALESLTQTRVKVQDVDWRWTGVANTFEVVSAQTRRTSLKDSATGQVANRYVCVLTLRRRFR